MATETLQVLLSANATAFARGMESAGKSVEAAGRQVSQFGGKLASVGAAVTAFGGVMVGEAAKYDRNVSNAVLNLKGAYSALATEIGRALLPTLREMAQFLSNVVRGWREMNPEVRQAITHYGGLAASIAAVVGVGAKVAGLGMQFAGLALQIAPVVLAVAAIGVTAAVVYKVWTDNIGGMKDWAKALFESIRSWLASVPGWFNTAFQLAKVPLLAFGRSLEVALGAMFGKDPGGIAGTLHEAMDAFEKAGVGDIADGIGDALKTSGLFVKGALVDGGKDLVELLRKKFPELAKLLGGRGGLVSPGLLLADQENFAKSPSRLSDEDLSLAERQAEDEYYAKRKGLLESSQAAWELVNEQERSMSDAMASTLSDIGATVDAFGERFGTLLEGVGQSITSKLGTRASGVLQGAQQGSAAGPWGAVIGAVAALLMQTKGFSALIQQLEDGLKFMADALEPLLAPMVVIGQLANDLLGAFGPLVDAFKLIGIAALFMTNAILQVNELLLTGMRDVANAMGLSGIATFINVNLLTPVSKAAMSAQSAMDKLANSTTEATDAQKESTRSIEGFAESLTNVPIGYKVASARYGAAAAGGTSGGMLPGGAGLPPISITIEGDMAALVTSVSVAEKKKSYRRTGSNYARSPGKPERDD